MHRLTTIVCLALLLHPPARMKAQDVTGTSTRQELISHAVSLHPSGDAVLLKEQSNTNMFSWENSMEKMKSPTLSLLYGRLCGGRAIVMLLPR
jgi:hypothetical protein